MLIVLLKGGSHLSNENDVFSFDLNESLYFEKGQEVSEMLGISLEPEISIQSFRDYVSIRGVIELQGEYRKNVSQDEQVEEPLDIHENHSWRYLERIEDKDNQHAVFSHRFPVEISVPSYRVTNMDDISVSIETFDYELPADNQLILTSTVEIYGISEEERSQEAIAEKDAEEMIRNISEDEEKSFEFEFKKEPSSERLLAVESENVADQPATQIEQREEVHETSEITEEETDEDDRWKYNKTQSVADFLKTDHDEVISSEEAEVTDEIEVSESDHETEASVNEEERETNYLEGLFNRHESEEEYVQMRIYIVQEADTLEIISERYEVPELQLLKQNRLEDDHLSEGQLLSIPFKSEE